MNTPYSLYNARISDLEHLLLKYRDKESGMRENILFCIDIMRCASTMIRLKALI